MNRLRAILSSLGIAALAILPIFAASLIVYGVSLVHVPAAFITAGVLILLDLNLKDRQ